jgi:hypothetical protein
MWRDLSIKIQYTNHTEDELHGVLMPVAALFGAHKQNRFTSTPDDTKGKAELIKPHAHAVLMNE